MPVVFRTTLSDEDFLRGLKRMESEAGKSGKKISDALAGESGSGGAKGRNTIGGVRMYGDILDQITGQYGGVMKMNSAVHLLGLSLGAAFVGVGVTLLGEHIYEDYEKTLKLNFELDKLRKQDFTAATASVGELTSAMGDAQKLKESFEEMQGTLPGQSTPSILGRKAMNFLSDLGDVFQGGENQPGYRWVSHDEKDANAIKKAQQMQQGYSESIADKMGDQAQVNAKLISGDKVRANIAKEIFDTQEKMGKITREGYTTGTDPTRQLWGEMALHAQRLAIIQGVTFDQQWKNARATDAPLVRDNDKAMKMDVETAKKRQENAEKHLTYSQQIHLLQNDITDQQRKQLDPNLSLLGKAEARAKIQDDIGRVRDLASQRKQMSPNQRHHMDAQERAMNRAANAAERHITAGMSKKEKDAFNAQQQALKDATKGATIDPDSIRVLTEAFKTAVSELIAR